MRGSGREFAAIEMDTEPLPIPLAVLVNVIQGALLCAVQPQPAEVLTAMVPVPPPTTTVCDNGVSVGLTRVRGNTDYQPVRALLDSRD